MECASHSQASIITEHAKACVSISDLGRVPVPCTGATKSSMFQSSSLLRDPRRGVSNEDLCGFKKWITRGPILIQPLSLSEEPKQVLGLLRVLSSSSTFRPMSEALLEMTCRAQHIRNSRHSVQPGVSLAEHNQASLPSALYAGEQV